MDSRNLTLDISVLDGLKEMSSEMGSTFVVELIELFIAQTNEKVPHIRQSLGARDVKKVTAEAHTLKSSSANLGASRFSSLCLALENWGREGNGEHSVAEELVASLEQELPKVHQSLHQYLEALARKSS